MSDNLYTKDGKWRLGWEFDLPSGNRVTLRPLDVAQLLKKRKTLPGDLMKVVERLFEGKDVPTTEEEANAEAAKELEGINRMDLLTQDRMYCEAVTSLMWVSPRVGETTDLEKGVIALDDIPVDDMRFTRNLAFKTVTELRFLADQQANGVELVFGQQVDEPSAEPSDEREPVGAAIDRDGG
jgi:hypothetical protein